jgi:hypothetical protein
MTIPNPPSRITLMNPPFRVKSIEDDDFFALHLDFDQTIQWPIPGSSDFVHAIALLKDNPTILDNGPHSINGL